MLIERFDEDNVVKIKCSCGEVFYSEKFDEFLRCKKCREKNKELEKNLEYKKAIENEFNKILYNLCEE